MDKPLTSWLKFADGKLADYLHERMFGQFAVELEEKIPELSSEAMALCVEPLVPQEKLYEAAAGYILHEAKMPYIVAGLDGKYYPLLNLAKSSLELAMSTKLAEVDPFNDAISMDDARGLQGTAYAELDEARQRIADCLPALPDLAQPVARMLKRFKFDDVCIESVAAQFGLAPTHPVAPADDAFWINGPKSLQ